MDRTRSAIRNSAISVLSQFIWLVGGFLIQIVFIRELSAQYVGANGLFTNLMGFLAFAELGLGTAFTFALFKPLADKDWHLVGIIVSFLKRTYNAIGLVIVVGGVGLSFALPWMVKDGAVIPQMQLLFILFIAGQAATYFFGYLRTFLLATPEMYLNTVNQTLFKVIQYALQLIFLMVWQSYFLYLLTILVANVTSNLVLARVVRKHFDQLEWRSSPSRLPREMLQILRQNVVGNVSSKFGTVVVNGTDNVILSKFLGLTVVGHYSAYWAFTTGLTAVLGQVMSGILPSLGNVGATEDVDHQITTYNRTLFLMSLITVSFAVGFYATVNGFVVLFFGASYQLPRLAVFALVLNFAIANLRLVNTSFISALGLFWHLRYKALWEAVVNLTASLILVIFFNMGVAGVLFGTAFSNLVINFWWEPLILFRHGFKRSVWISLRKSIWYHASLISFLALIWLLNFSATGLLDLVVAGFVFVGLAAFIFVLLNITSPELKFLVTKVRKMRR
jgi:O-antigen/teichoic acid export membrane protein